MRIISGKYKGRHFDVPRNFKARPTTDFAKENLFNILANNVDFEETIALDLFSGTGINPVIIYDYAHPYVYSLRNHYETRKRRYKQLGFELPPEETTKRGLFQRGFQK